MTQEMTMTDTGGNWVVPTKRESTGIISGSGNRDRELLYSQIPRALETKELVYSLIPRQCDLAARAWG